LSWNKIIPFLGADVHINVAQGAAALVANLTTNGNFIVFGTDTNKNLADTQKSVVTSGTLKKLASLLSLKNPTIDRCVIFAFANASFTGMFSLLVHPCLLALFFIVINPSTGSTALLSNDVMGLLIKRLESEEDETLLLPFAKALHRLALQGINLFA
jgi:hypothetical protein